MKFFLTLLIIANINPVISDLRSLYQVAAIDEKKLDQLVNLSKKHSSKGSLYTGYYGAGKIIQAKYAFNPYTKWNLFLDGKKILESAIASDANNLELRYLRLTIQMNSPSILGYKNDIITDKTYIKNNIKSINDTELRDIIKNYLTNLK